LGDEKSTQISQKPTKSVKSRILYTFDKIYMAEDFLATFL
jgi:hypothetical protein